MRAAFWPILLTAASYYVAGRLGLLLAIPPGYATAVWPASGLALAAIILAGRRVWPGVLLGSFFVNVGTSFDAGSTASILRSLAIAGGIGAGAALQAVAGGWLIERYTTYRNILTQELGAVKLLLLGGPVSCMVNSVIGVGTLWMAGLVPSSNLLFNWWTWWVGDSIGVLIFTPLVLVWTLRPLSTWFRRQVAFTLPMVIMFSLVVALFVYVSGREEARIQAEFEKWAERFQHELNKDLEVYLSVLDAIRGLYESSNVVEPAEFRQFTERLLPHNEDVQALSWNAKVLDAEREAFESAMRESVAEDYQIYELDSQRKYVPAGSRIAHYPVVVTMPFEKNRRSLGFDIGSESVRRKTIEQALHSGQASATGPIDLVQVETDRTGVLIITPTYRNGDSDGDLLGFAVVAVRIANLMRSAVAVNRNTGLVAHVHDVTDEREPVFLFSSDAGGYSEDASSGLHMLKKMNVAGRVWQLDFRVPAKYLVANRSWQAWAMLAGGLLFTGLVGVFLLLGTGYTTRIQAIVEARTSELNRTNNELEQEVAERARLQFEADQRSEELADKNQELESFAYIVSHDLQAPLRAMTGFAQLLDERYRDKFDGEAREFLKYIVDCAAQMRQMIFDILELSRVSSKELKREPVDVNALLDKVRQALSADLKESGAGLEYAPLPVVQADNGQLLQLFQNLIGNAIKFRPRGRKPVVRISAEPADEGWHFQVADNGIGIPKEKQAQLFALFMRLHTTEEYPGTGLGLAICKRIVQRHGGRIWLESVPGEGTTFHFTLREA